MGNSKVVILLFLFNVVCAVSANNVLSEISEKELKKHVFYLSANNLEGRLTGSEGELLATKYIANLFKKFNLAPAGVAGSFFQEFNIPASIKASAHLKNAHGRNVLAKLEINDSCEQYILLGAHVDHLGKGQLGGALDYNKGLIYFGADDNASGVAAILAVAKKLSELKALGKLHGNKNILFAIWSGEELGILGSTHFVKNISQNATRPLTSVIYSVINLDMVGHLRGNLVLQGIGSSSDWLPIINKIKLNHSFSIITQEDPYLPTDTTAFYVKHLPIINFFTGAHENYHTVLDKPETLNYQGIKKISDFLVDLVLSLEEKPNFMNYQEVQKPHNSLQDLKIYLGTIPDYSSADVIGVKLLGVTKNSPAAIAGLQPNDILVELAGKQIHDIYDYTTILNSLNVNQPVKSVLLRGQEKVVQNIIPKNRE